MAVSDYYAVLFRKWIRFMADLSVNMRISMHITQILETYRSNKISK